MFKTVNEIIKANKRIGQHFFDEGTMNFFNSRIPSQEVYGGHYFITSERFALTDEYPAMYTIRYAENDGKVDTIGEFQQYDKYIIAKRQALLLAYMQDRPLGLYNNLEEILYVNKTIVQEDFFGTQQEQKRTFFEDVYGGCYFVTRELIGTSDEDYRYIYCVYQCAEDGTIGLVEDNFSTLFAAKNYARLQAHLHAKWPLFTNIEQIKTANERAGEYYFSPNTLRGFKSRIGSTIYGGKFFIVSKQPPYPYKREYDVYEVRSDGTIHRQEDRMHLSYYKARKLAKELGNIEDAAYSKYYRG